MLNENNKNVFYYASCPVKEDQLVKIVLKVWGHEEWIVNNEKYCGKKLVFKKGYRCSMHYHKIKDETFYVISGKILMELDGVKRIMTPGDSQRILPGQKHRVTAYENSSLFEISTFHMDEDSYREEVSGKI